MAEIVRMPKLSDTMTEGVVAEWHKNVGDNIESGELLAEIETDKATMEFESFQEGVLLHIGVEKGQTAPVDSILAILGEKGEDVSELLKEEAENDDKEENVSAKNDSPVVEKVAVPKDVPSVTPPNPIVAPKPASSPVMPAAASNSNFEVKASPLAKKLAEREGQFTIHKRNWD